MLSKKEKDSLIMSQQLYAYKCAHSYTRDPDLVQILAQEGMMGAVEAAQLYDPSRGHTFSTYAVWRIRERMQRYFRTEKRHRGHYGEVENLDELIGENIENGEDICSKEELVLYVKNKIKACAEDSFRLKHRKHYTKRGVREGKNGFGNV